MSSHIDRIARLPIQLLKVERKRTFAHSYLGMLEEISLISHRVLQKLKSPHKILGLAHMRAER